MKLFLSAHFIRDMQSVNISSKKINYIFLKQIFYIIDMDIFLIFFHTANISFLTVTF